MRSFRAGVLLAVAFWSLAPPSSWGEGPPKSAAAGTPAATPLSEVELLAIMLQVVQRIDACIRTDEIDMIHNEDALVRTPYVEFMKDAYTTRFADPQAFRTALFQFVGAIVTLHSAADASDQAALKERFPHVLEAFGRVKSFYPPKTLAAAQALADRYTCPMHPEVVGKDGDVCPKCGMTLDQMVRVLPRGVAASERTMRAGIRLGAPLTPGQPADAILTLTKADGSPVAPSDLIEVHTARIHLLVIDPSLTDYHHVHPQPTATPGEYAFTFTPRKASRYRAWADLRPYPVGLQEYAVADIPGPTGPDAGVEKTITSHAEVDDLRFDLVLARPQAKVGRTTPAELRVTRADGTPFRQLEPIMETFAHLVAFSEDYETVLHMHPKGPPVLDADARGGPKLDVQLYPLKPGFYRLFAQVQVDGTSKFAPFGVRVTP